MENIYNFNVKKTTEDLIKWTSDWFDKNGKGCNAIIGISGGKDSTIAAAICAKALGNDRVIGVLMPDGEQKDIEDSKKVCEILNIKHYIVDISKAIIPLLKTLSGNDFEISEQTKVNLAPRIRMTTLYAIAQSCNGRVINTCNLSENICGFSTLYGDHAGDMSLFDELTVTEIRKIGHFLGLPDKFVDKKPSDGLTGKTDEDVYDFTYEVLDKFIRTGICEDEIIKNKVIQRYKAGVFKTKLINFPHFQSNYPVYKFI